MNFTKNTRSGFTIVELLIVIVVIAILAAITIVAYNGVTRQAEESAMQSNLRTAANKVAVWHVKNDAYPSLEQAGIDTGELGGFTLNYMPGGSSYCLEAVSAVKSFFISNETGSIQEGNCTPSIQNFTRAQCNALPVYTGSNEEALRTVKDERGGTIRSYRIAKLADNNCWMLDNLKLGSTTVSVTLTPSDSNVSSNFTLPQLITSGSVSNDSPQAIGPVPNDTGTGATNYGYLYNWPAATAGESTTSFPGGSGNAPYSICPASWRLPTGGSGGEFDQLAGALGDSINRWNYTSPFRGVFSGQWSGSFSSQGSSGVLWTSSATPYATNAHTTLFNNTFIFAGNSSSSRYEGRAVRCILN